MWATRTHLVAKAPVRFRTRLDALESCLKRLFLPLRAMGKRRNVPELAKRPFPEWGQRIGSEVTSGAVGSEFKESNVEATCRGIATSSRPRPFPRASANPLSSSWALMIASR